MRKWLILGGALTLVLIAGGVCANRAQTWLAAYVRERAINTLRQDFASDVEFGDLQVSIFPKVMVRGDGLVLRQHDRTGVPPLIRIDKFWLEARPVEFLRAVRHIRKLTLQGMVIVVPPRKEHLAGEVQLLPVRKRRPPFKVHIDEIVADGTELDILLKDPSKPPRIFEISHLTLHDAGLGRAMTYRATLSNPLPAGEIESQGEFGPWQRDDPRQTPLAGTYTLSHADLSSFRGLSGILTSQGEFRGQLEHIEVQGETKTPNFSLGISGHPVPLDTQFHAIVDGSNGNTMLEQVHARLLNSEISAHGGILRMPGQQYRRILLDAASHNAKLEDLLRLAIKTDTPAMTGLMSFQTRIDIPPGSGVMADRLKLSGHFNISSARFSQLNIQEKAAKLSRKGQGETDDQNPGSVASDFAGHFELQNALMTFSNLTFGVPGASVHLEGTYALRGEDVDFRGTLRLQAKLSQTTHGWKSALLKPVDPIFARQGAGTLLPITITGTGSDPKFKLDIRRVF